MATPSETDGGLKPSRTTLAFLLAPGSAALVGAAGLMVWWGTGASSDRLGPLVVATFYLAYGLALVGYPTALIIAVPVYILLPEHAREKPLVVILLAGCIAAAPWIPIAAVLDLGCLPVEVALGLGCLAGIFFVLIRSLPRRTRTMLNP